jgi:invasion protein IalB
LGGGLTVVRFRVAVFCGLVGLLASNSGWAAQGAPKPPSAVSREPAKLDYLPWTKSCTREKTADARQVCVTVLEGRADDRKMAITAMLVQREGDPRVTLRALFRLGMQIIHGTRIFVDPLKSYERPYPSCTAYGCFSDYVLDESLLQQIKDGKQLSIQSINANGSPLTFALPMKDFGRVFDGSPKEWNSAVGREKVLEGITKLSPPSIAAPANANLIYSPWTKFCLKGNGDTNKPACFTGTDGRSTTTGVPEIAAVLIEPEGDPKKILRITLPLNMNLDAGIQVSIDSAAPMPARYVICFANGCMADYDATQTLLGSMSAGQLMTIRSTTYAGAIVTKTLPLGTFQKALSGAPVDPKSFDASQKKLQAELASGKRPANPEITDRSDITPTASAAAVATPGPRPAVGDRRIALVIGNSAYENAPALANPRRDAVLVADILKRTGFESVTVQTDLRKDALVGALRAFAARAETADWAVVYYAGHGMEVGGVNYLVPIDARIAADRDVGFEAVPLEQVLNAAERAKKLRLVILDACRDNPFANQMKRTLTVASRSVTRGLAAVEPEAGTLVVYAAKDGETALDGSGANSPFATAFVRNLQTPGLEVRRLFDFVRDDVMDLTNRKQKPFSYGSISGRQDFYFVAAK